MEKAFWGILLIVCVLLLFVLKAGEILENVARKLEAPPELHDYLVKNIERDHGSLPMMRVRQLVDMMRKDSMALNACEDLFDFAPYREFRQDLFDTMRDEIIQKVASNEALWKKVAPRWKKPRRRARFAGAAADEVLEHVDSIARAFWDKRRELSPHQ